MSRKYERPDKFKRVPARRTITTTIIRTENSGSIRRRKGRNYRRSWVKGHYRRTWIITLGDERKQVRKWYKGYWRRIKIKLNTGGKKHGR